jgi:hypothetical protein
LGFVVVLSLNSISFNMISAPSNTHLNVCSKTTLPARA